MRNVFLFMMVSLDGFFEGPNQEIDWHNVDDEFNDFAIKQLDEIGALLFGRVTYQLMASYWPTPAALADDPIVAEKMNTIPKVVFSTTLDTVDWANTRLVRGDASAEVMKLKQQPGKDLAIFGSADLTTALLEAGLVDELRIMVNPVALGNGKPLFAGLRDRVNLKLVNSRGFDSGNVLLSYQPEQSEVNR
ncbi:MAG: dihydrofolate reductase family protein [Thermomicrobiales bacterium]